MSKEEGEYGFPELPVVSEVDTRPQRIQLSRAKGWRMPPNTVKVTRPGKWGNPFTTANALYSGYTTADQVQAFVVECFRDWLGPSQSGRAWWQGPESDRRRKVFACEIGELRGKNLACWCKPGAPCHADVLLELANSHETPAGLSALQTQEQRS